MSIVKHGGSLDEVGFICFSKKKKNMVISNIVGCAAYYGKQTIVEKVLSKLGPQFAEAEAMEQPDPSQKGVFKKEFSRYTPLMLSAAGEKEKLETFKCLLKYGASFNCVDEYQNTILHIAAKYGHNKILKHVAENLNINIFSRNKDGETALNICVSNKNTEGEEILTKF